jgi:hypothetical protein
MKVRARFWQTKGSEGAALEIDVADLTAVIVCEMLRCQTNSTTAWMKIGEP